MSTETLKVNTEWLIWARKSVHYDKKEVANLMKIDEKTLTNGKILVKSHILNLTS